MVFLGNPEYGVNVAPLDFVKLAEGRRCARNLHRRPDDLTQRIREAFSWDGPVIVECVVDEHVPPMPAKVTKDQVTKLVDALRHGTPNRNRIALQMVKDMLVEASFDASSGHVIPGRVGKALSGAAERLRNRADSEHPR